MITIERFNAACDYGQAIRRVRYWESVLWIAGGMFALGCSLWASYAMGQDVWAGFLAVVWIYYAVYRRPIVQA